MPLRFPLLLLALLSGLALAPTGPARLYAASGFVDEYLISAPDFTSSAALVILEYLQAPSDESEVAEATLFLIDNPSAPNRLSDRPVQSFPLEVLRSPGEDAQKKVSYRLSRPSRAGNQARPDLLGLPPADSWTLRGSDRDAGLLRTYLALQLARALRSVAAPEGKYCELIFKYEGAYYYQGLYLLMESIEDGLFTAPEALAGIELLAHPPLKPAARPGDSGYRLKAVDGRPAPPAGLFPKLEGNLASTDPKIFFKAQAGLDLDSFVETYLLDLVLMNYPPDSQPFYLFQKSDGRIGASVLWDFDRILDNADEAYPVDDSFDDNYTWFRSLLESSDFIGGLRKRFYSLDRNDWNAAAFERSLDELVYRLGPALERDRARWDEVYSEIKLNLQWMKNELTGEPEEIVRQTSSTIEDLIKIKSKYRENNLIIKSMMERLRWKKIVFNDAKKISRNVPLTAGFVLLFFITVSFVRRRM